MTYTYIHAYLMTTALTEPYRGTKVDAYVRKTTTGLLDIYLSEHGRLRDQLWVSGFVDD